MIQGSALFDAKAHVNMMYGHMEQKRRTIDIPGFKLTWRFGEQRLTGGCQDNVLTITEYLIRRGHNKRAITQAFVETIIRGVYPMPTRRIDFLHFLAPPFNLKGVLQQLHFHPYQIGQRLDYWHVVDGQGELL